MIERYRNHIDKLEDISEIGDLLLSDKKYQKHLADYLKNPYDAKFYSIEKGLFNVAVATPKSPTIEKAETESDYMRIISNISTRLICAGSNHASTTNIDDIRVGIMGILDDESDKTPMSFQKKGDTIYLLGLYNEDPFDDQVTETLNAIRKAIKRGYISSAHAITSNGLFLALVESSVPNGLGFDITSDAELEDKDFFFGHSKYLTVVTVNEEQENHLVEYMFNCNIPIFLLGHVTKGVLRSDECSFGDINSILKTLN